MCSGVLMCAARKGKKFQATLLQVIYKSRYIRLSSLENTTLWYLMDLFAQGNVNLPISTPHYKTPQTYSMHYSFARAQFLLTWKSLDNHAGLLHRTLCLRGIAGCGRTLFSHVIFLVCLVSALQFSYEFHREKERRGGGEKRKTGFSCGAQHQQRRRRRWMSWPMKGQLLDGFPHCVLGGTAFRWHLQTTNKAVRLDVRFRYIFFKKPHAHIAHKYLKVPKKKKKRAQLLWNKPLYIMQQHSKTKPLYIKQRHSSATASSPPPRPSPILKSKIAFTVTTNHSIF